jgi:hypothetical protein
VKGGKMLEIGLMNKNYDDIRLNDQVDLFGMKGKICFEVGAYGIGFQECIDYDLIQEEMDKDSNCCGNKYYGCFNDHFLSLYELYNAFNCDEGCVYILEKFGDEEVK